jgi:hypothetical protein
VQAYNGISRNQFLTVYGGARITLTGVTFEGYDWSGPRW